MQLKNFTNNPDLGTWLLRLGLVFIFAYAGVQSLMHPAEWVGFMPTALTQHFDANMLLKFFSVLELLLAAWLLIGKYLRFAALFAAAMLVGITLSNIPQLIITFRDVGLAAMALALAAIAKD
jgi:uncharacterized membrane protein YphA (DoxX/SURF4 family)